MMDALRRPVFRAAWIGSIFSNMGLMIQGVGAAWAMTALASADRVALIQTATLAPYLLFSVASGAMADMHDRRWVQIISLSFALISAVALTIVSWSGLVTPGTLLIFCFLIGTGVACFGPAWQASAAEQVSRPLLPAAVALNSVSFNLARSFGPGIGGVIVAFSGVTGSFLANAVFYLPMLVSLIRWRRETEPPRLPPERIGGAILTGLRFVLHSPPIRVSVVRSFLIGTIGFAPTALMPLVARNLLDGDAKTFGWLLCSLGIGAVSGVWLLSRGRERWSPEYTLRIAGAVMGAAVIGAAISRSLLLTAPCLFVAGANWMIMITTLNISIQIPSPRWVAGRTTATFQALIAGGCAIGSWAWGLVAAGTTVDTALIADGIALLCSPLLGLLLPIARPITPDDRSIQPEDLDVRLALTDRSGPIVVTVEYRISPNDARAFYRHLQTISLGRKRNGAYGWSLARDVADPEIWIERFHCPTWLDYLRLRSRMTKTERDDIERGEGLHKGPGPVFVRHMLERPFGSVRWTDAVPDEGSVRSPDFIGFPAITSRPLS